MGSWLSPAEARRLASALAAILGLLALAALLAFLVVPGLRYQADPDLGRQGGGARAGGLASGWLDPTEYPPTPRQVIPPMDPATIMAPTPALLARGRELYQRECVLCHGPEGRGDGVGGRALDPGPRDFTSPAGWKVNPHLDGIYLTLEKGIPGTGMASYRQLSRRDRMALAHFVQSLGRFQRGQGDPAARAALERQFATTGEVLPNRIPVRQAIAILCREYAAAHPAPKEAPAPAPAPASGRAPGAAPPPPVHP